MRNLREGEVIHNLTVIRIVIESELRVYECETDGHAQHDDDRDMWIVRIKAWRVVEELMRKIRDK